MFQYGAAEEHCNIACECVLGAGNSTYNLSSFARYVLTYDLHLLSNTNFWSSIRIELLTEHDALISFSDIHLTKFTKK